MKNIAIKIEILKEARKVIAAGRKRGICAATRLVTSRDDHFSDRDIAGEQIREYLSRALGRHAYLEQWVASEVGHAVPMHGTRAQRRKMRNTRLAWIDWIIEQYEKKMKRST